MGERRAYDHRASDRARTELREVALKLKTGIAPSPISPVHSPFDRIKYQYFIETLLTNASAPTFIENICIRCSDRRRHYTRLLGFEDGIKRFRGLLVIFPD